MSSPLAPRAQTQILTRLLAWYGKNGRHDMPWRKTKDPYAILVSEFMLQQTTVTAVLPFYDRFIKFFPTMKSLAESTLDEVIALWSGLGYYARARNLWASMRMVSEDFKGRIPSDQASLQKLPGVGLYTSGAITSLAFNKPAVVLDGNIIRVLMRVLALEEDPRLKAVQVILRKVSLDLTTRSLKINPSKNGGPKHAVLALMDLGATVCLPENPLCGMCPLTALCLARRYGKQDFIPAKGDETARLKVRRLFALIQKNGRWLMGKRPEDGLFGGLWEFPGVDATTGVEQIELIEQAVKKELRAPVRVVQAMKSFDHQLSHRDFSIRPFLCELPDPKRFRLPPKGVDYLKFVWVYPRDISRLGISAITKKILSQALKNNVTN